MSAGPYIVTTRQPCSEPCGCSGDCISREAFATLEEARSVVIDACAAANLRDAHVVAEKVADLIATRRGGSYGPMPDGTRIEVEATTSVALATATEEGRRWLAGGSGMHLYGVLAAWNAEYGTGIGARSQPSANPRGGAAMSKRFHLVEAITAGADELEGDRISAIAISSRVVGAAAPALIEQGRELERARIAELEAEVERLSRRPDLSPAQCADLEALRELARARWSEVRAALRSAAEQEEA